MSRVVLPGATIGVLGSGQLGRMMAIAARRMGYRVHTFSPGEDTPTGQVADLEITADYEDLDAIRTFAKGVHVVTFEFENVLDRGGGGRRRDRAGPPERCGAAHHAAASSREGVPRRSRHSQPRPVPRFATLDELAVALGGHWRAGDRQDRRVRVRRQGPASHSVDRGRRARVGPDRTPGSRRRTRGGFQPRAVGRGGARARWRVRPLRCDREHARAITSSISPSRPRGCLRPWPPRPCASRARSWNELEYVGVLCVEFFLTRDGQLLVNEIAPRPHNSGHLTFDACLTSQFEQQVRAVCGLPLGSTAQMRPAAMVNLLGDLWMDGEPDWSGAPGATGREAAPVRQEPTRVWAARWATSPRSPIPWTRRWRRR